MLRAKQLTLADLEFNAMTNKEYITPEQSMKGCAPAEVKNFCNAVKEMRKIADGAWGWCNVSVTGVLKGDIKFNDVEYLRCCSYKSKADFIAPGGYYEDMCKTILFNVQKQLDHHVALINESISRGTLELVGPLELVGS